MSIIISLSMTLELMTLLLIAPTELKDHLDGNVLQINVFKTMDIGKLFKNRK